MNLNQVNKRIMPNSNLAITRNDPLCLQTLKKKHSHTIKLKNWGISSIFIAGSFLSACNTGYNYITPTPPQTYSFTNVSSNTSTVGCNTAVSPFSCNKESSSITFNLSLTTSPDAFLQLPVANSLTSGLSMDILANCPQTPTANLECNVEFNANNVASGTTLILPLNGSLGAQTFYSVIFQ